MTIAGLDAECYRRGVGVLRNPLVAIGLVLMVLGAGNWYAGWDKIQEHERLLAASRNPAHRPAFDDFPNLTQRATEELLRSFQGGSDTAELAGVKLDFYRVVHAGGRFLFLLGALGLGIGVVQERYRARHRRHVDRAITDTPA